MRAGRFGQVRRDADRDQRRRLPVRRPGAAYYQFDYQIDYATQRPLYSYKPTETHKTPDLAAAQPTISADNKIVTIRSGAACNSVRP